MFIIFVKIFVCFVGFFAQKNTEKSLCFIQRNFGIFNYALSSSTEEMYHRIISVLAMSRLLVQQG